jgi:protein-disulfide isomerase
VPVAVFGALAFAAAALLSIAGFVARQEVRESVPGYLFVLSTLSLAVILYLGYASFFILKAVCLLCLTTYAAVIGLFLVSGAATSFPMTTLPRRAARDTRVFLASPIALIVALLFFAGAATTLAFFPREGATAPAPESAAAETSAAMPTQDQRSEFERWYASQPRVPLVIPSDGAKVLVVKFQDFQCPPCGQTYLQYKPIFAKYDAEHPSAVKVVYKDFPLNPDCNPGVAQMIHPAACDAAVAVRLAAEHNRHDQMEEWLYTHQPAQTPPSVRQAARDIGNVADFDAKYQSTIAAVKSDAALGRQLGVKSTPTFFINGVKIEGGLPPQYFDQAIAYELQRANAK